MKNITNVENPKAIARSFKIFLDEMTSEEALFLITKSEEWSRDEIVFIAYNLGGIEFSEYIIRKSKNPNNNVKSMSFIRNAWKELVNKL